MIRSFDLSMMNTQSKFYSNYFLYGFGHNMLWDSVILMLLHAPDLVQKISCKDIQLKMSATTIKLTLSYKNAKPPLPQKNRD